MSAKNSLIDSLQRQNKQLNDSLFYIGYNFKDHPKTMDSLFGIGEGDCARDVKQKSGFHGF